jgi:hypothetical protein
MSGNKTMKMSVKSRLNEGADQAVEPAKTVLMASRMGLAAFGFFPGTLANKPPGTEN